MTRVIIEYVTNQNVAILLKNNYIHLMNLK